MSNSINMELLKNLREKTSAGMVDCKNALLEADGNIEKATEILRKKGLSNASKKAGRLAAENARSIYRPEECRRLRRAAASQPRFELSQAGRFSLVVSRHLPAMAGIVPTCAEQGHQIDWASVCSSAFRRHKPCRTTPKSLHSFGGRLKAVLRACNNFCVT